MASIFGHLAAGYTIGKMVHWKSSWKLLFLASLSAFLPDIDVIGFPLGIPYEHPLGHRGFTHSIVFALLWGVAVSFLFRRHRFRAFAVIFLSTLSHPFLDAMTSGGLGVAFFAPFNNERYFFPFRPIRVSPIGVDAFLSHRGLTVIYSELLWVIVPCIVLLLIKKIARR